MNGNETKDRIDAIDRQIIKLISKRSRFIDARQRTGKRSIIDDILRERRCWAYLENVNPDIIVSIYRNLYHYYKTEPEDEIKKRMKAQNRGGIYEYE